MNEPHLDPDMTNARGPVVDQASTYDATGAYHPAPDTEPHIPAPPAGAPTIPGYTVMRLLAKGGMGAVWLGRDRVLDRDVAIKTLLPGADAGRFVTESKITAKLPHPGIPPVHALGTLDDGSPYLVMKYVQGKTLAELLKARSSPADGLPRFVQAFEQIAQAVGFAHSQGVIHRDLKPLNVMVGAFGEVQVMDWGLAKDLRAGSVSDDYARRAGSVSDDPAAPGHTEFGVGMGTPGYVAPEQARGEAVDARADVFALGAVLTTLLTGRPAFVSPPGAKAREKFQTAARADLADALARLDVCPADAELVSLAKRCLAPTASDRPADGRAVADAVAAYRAGVEDRLRAASEEAAATRAREAEQRKRRRVMQWAAGIVAGVLLAGIAGTTMGLLRAREQEGIAKGETAAKELARLAEAERAEGERLAKVDAEKKQKEATLQARRAENVLGITTEVFRTSDPTGLTGVGLLPPGQRVRNLTIADMLAAGSVSLKDRLRDDPLARAAMLDVLGELNRSVGNKALAKEQLEEALSLRMAHLPCDHHDTVTSRFHLANWQMELGRHPDALKNYEVVIAAHEAEHTLHTPEGMDRQLRYAVALAILGDPAAIDYAKRVADYRAATCGKSHRDTVVAKLVLSTALLENGEHKTALASVMEAMTHLLKTPDAAGDKVIYAIMEFQKAILASRVLPTVAEAGMRKAAALLEAALGGDHVYLALIKAELGIMLSNQGRNREAENEFEACFDIVRRTIGLGHPRVLRIVPLYAHVCKLDGQSAKAWSLVEQSLENAENSFPNEARWRLPATCAAASVAGILKRRAECRKYTLQAFETFASLGRTLTYREEQMFLSLADSVFNSNQGSDIAALCERYDALPRRFLSPRSEASFLSYVAGAHVENGRYGEGLRILDRIYDRLSASAMGEEYDPNMHMLATYDIGRAWWSQGRGAEAFKMLELAEREGRAKSLPYSKVTCSIFLFHLQRGDWKAAAQANRWGSEGDASPTVRALSACVRAGCSALDPVNPKLDLKQLEESFGRSVEPEVVTCRARAVLFAGGDTRREWARVETVYGNGYREPGFELTRVAYLVHRSEHQRALDALATVTVPSASPYCGWLKELLAESARHGLSARNKPLPDLVARVRHSLESPAIRNDAGMKAVDASFALEVEWWMRRGLTTDEPGHEVAPAPKPVK